MESFFVTLDGTKIKGISLPNLTKGLCFIGFDSKNIMKFIKKLNDTIRI